MGIAYWISPKGHIIDVKSKHISTVIEHPKKFGFDNFFIEFMYDNYGEKVGTEGKAREQILMSLFKNNWIRIRKYKKFWTLNVNKLAGRAASYVTLWARKILKGLHGFKETDPFAVVNVDQKGKPIKSYEIQKLADSEKFVFECRLTEKTIEELPDLPLNDIVNEMMSYGVRRMSLMEYLNEI